LGHEKDIPSSLEFLDQFQRQERTGIIVYDRLFNLLRARPGHWLVYLLFGLSAFPASALSTIPLSSIPPVAAPMAGGGWQFTDGRLFTSGVSGTTLSNPGLVRAWLNGTGGVTAADALSLSGRAGSLAVTARTTVSAAEVALSLARVAGGVGTAFAVGSFAYDLLAGAGVRSGASGAEIDAGAEKTSGTCSGYTDFSGPTRVDCLPAKAWCDIRAANVLESFSGTYQKRGRLSGSGSTLACVSELTQDGINWNPLNIDIMGNPVTITNAKSCPSLIDASTGESYTPGTYSDGKCITGRYQAATEAQVAARIQSAVDSDVSNSAKAAIAAGAEIQSSGFAVTGPASQIGTPTSTTTTTPDGTTTTTTTTPTYNYTYDGDKVTYTTTNETKVCTGANSCTTTTTTTAPTTKQDPADPCTADPTRAGCTDLGDPNLKDKVPDDPWTFPGIIAKTMPSNKSCPSPITVNIPHGPAVVFSFEPLCDICLNYISKIVSVMSILTAVSVFVRSFKV
jgi:hypothetical protein